MISLLLLCCIPAVILTYLIVKIYKSFVQFLQIRDEIAKLPGPPYQNFLHGSARALLGPPEVMFRTLREWGLQYYPIYKMTLAYVHTANFMHPHDFETILSSMKHIAKTDAYDMLHSWLDTGLLTSDGSKWQNRRKILTPAFHFSILQEFLKIFENESHKLVEVLKRECHRPYVELSQCISSFTLNTVAETAMGVNLDQEADKGREYRRAVEKISELIRYRLVRPWMWAPFLYLFHPNSWIEKKVVKTLHRFTENVITKREENIADFNYSKSKRLAMLDLLLAVKKEDGSIDQKGIREEVDTFMFEGHDTTSSAICFALMVIACHPQIQEQIVDEMRQVLDGSPLNYQALLELKYMERCIKEVLRLYPSVAFITRILGEDITTFSGHHLKAGTRAHLHIFDLHRNPEIYLEPERFDPDRFLPENCQKRHNFAYVPFSAGPRNCIGQKFAMLEVKTVLSGVLSEFVLEPVDDPGSLVLVNKVILRTTTPIRVKFVPRRNPVIRMQPSVLSDVIEKNDGVKIFKCLRIIYFPRSMLESLAGLLLDKEQMPKKVFYSNISTFDKCCQLNSLQIK